MTLAEIYAESLHATWSRHINAQSRGGRGHRDRTRPVRVALACMADYWRLA